MTTHVRNKTRPPTQREQNKPKRVVSNVAATASKRGAFCDTCAVACRRGSFWRWAACVAFGGARQSSSSTRVARNTKRYEQRFVSPNIINSIILFFFSFLNHQIKQHERARCIYLFSYVGNTTWHNRFFFSFLKISILIFFFYLFFLFTHFFFHTLLFECIASAPPYVLSLSPYLARRALSQAARLQRQAAFATSRVFLACFWQQMRVQLHQVRVCWPVAPNTHVLQRTTISILFLSLVCVCCVVCYLVIKGLAAAQAQQKSLQPLATRIEL